VRSVGAALLGAALFGTAGIAQAFAPEGAHPLAVGALRLGVGALALTTFVLARGGTVRGLLSLWKAKAALLAATGAAAYQPLFFSGILQTGVPLGTLVAVGSAPVFTGLLSWGLRRERPTTAWVLATLVCVAGLAVLTGEGVRGGSLVGILLTAGAGLSIAAYMVSAKVLLDRGRGILEVTASAFLLGALVVVPVAALTGLGWVYSPSGALVVGYLGLVTMGLANVLYARGLGGLAAPITATLGLGDPLTATLLGVLVLGQQLSGLGVAGLAVLFVGLVLQGVWAPRGSRSGALPVG
jgi:DME family drug/metabolite transporter